MLKNKATEWTPSSFDKPKSIFSVLEGFRMTEVLKHNKQELKTKFENGTGDERVVTQTADTIKIRITNTKER